MSKVQSEYCYLISGLSGTIGTSLANLLTSKGCRVIGITRSNLDENLLEKYPNIEWISYDASKMDPTKEVFNNLTSLVPERLSGVFHCSGQYSKGSTLDLSQEDYLDSLKANLISAINVTKLSIDLVKPGGSIIILNSQASSSASQEEISYGVSKRAISSYIDGMQIEATKRELQIVNVLCGAVQSSMAEGRDDYKKFISPNELSKILYSLSKAGKSLRIKDIEILRRQY